MTASDSPRGDLLCRADLQNVLGAEEVRTKRGPNRGIIAIDDVADGRPDALDS